MRAIVPVCVFVLAIVSGYVLRLTRNKSSERPPFARTSNGPLVTDLYSKDVAKRETAFDEFSRLVLTKQLTNLDDKEGLFTELLSVNRTPDNYNLAYVYRCVHVLALLPVDRKVLSSARGILEESVIGIPDHDRLRKQIAALAYLEMQDTNFFYAYVGSNPPVKNAPWYDALFTRSKIGAAAAKSGPGPSAGTTVSNNM